MLTTLRLFLLLMLGLLGLQPVGYAYGVPFVLVSEVQYTATVSSETEAKTVESPAQVVSNSDSERAAWDRQADTREFSDFVAAENAPLAKVLEGHAPGQGFSGVFDASTGKVLMSPSTDAATLPEGWVARYGGHADVSAALGGDASAHSGFVAILQEDGSLAIRWRSGTLNPPPTNLVPESLQPAIIKSVQDATGRNVVSP